MLPWDGEPGLQLAQENRPDLVILDWDAARHGRVWKSATSAGVAEYSILMLTAKETTEARVHGLDAGADDYVVKPLNWKNCWPAFAPLLRRTQSTGRRC